MSDAPVDAIAPLREALLGGGFAVAPQTTRVLFGANALERLPELVDALPARRVFVVASAGRGALVERVRALLAGRVVGVDTRAAMHVPAALAADVAEQVARADADLVLALGGGSPIGMAKAVALGGGPPILALPTTYAGSEMTAIWGITRDGAKTTGRDERVRPRAVLYDPTLTLDLPPRVSAPSAMNAVAHCMEALYAPDASPLVAMSAAEGLRALHASAAAVARDPRDLAARTLALYGAWLAGLALGGATMGLHHKLCHVLGGSFGLPHAETHAVVLPHAIAYNARSAPAAMQVAAHALGAVAGDAVPDTLHASWRELAAAARAPTSLRELGLHESDVARAAEIACASPYPNPRPLDVGAVSALLARAHAGRPPTLD